jgi:hypothetical protein
MLRENWRHYNAKDKLASQQCTGETGVTTILRGNGVSTMLRETGATTMLKKN